MPTDLLAGARTTKNAPRVQDAHRAAPPRKTEGAMSLEEFMRRNPHARDVDAIKTAQTDQGKRSGPKTHPTSRSQRKNPRKPRPTQGVIARAARAEQALENPDPMKWNVNKVRVAGDQVDFLTPTNPGLGRGPRGDRPMTEFTGRDMFAGEADDAYKAAMAEGKEKHRVKNAEELFRRSFER